MILLCKLLTAWILSFEDKAKTIVNASDSLALHVYNAHAEGNMAFASGQGMQAVLEGFSEGFKDQGRSHAMTARAVAIFGLSGPTAIRSMASASSASFRASANLRTEASPQ